MTTQVYLLDLEFGQIEDRQIQIINNFQLFWKVSKRAETHNMNS